MGQSQPGEVKRIEATINRIERDKPPLKAVANAFREVLVSRARLKAGMPAYQGPPLPSPDPGQQSRGVPLLTREDLAGLADPWGETAAAALASLASAFPSIGAEAGRLREAFDAGRADLGRCLRALAVEGEDELEGTASRLDIPAPVLAFILGQMLKPFVEKRTAPLQALVRQLPWHRGYCPVCGSFPEMTWLQGEEGQRWLRCSLCGHQWQFDRMRCPHCEAQGQKKRLIYVEGCRHEYAETYADCRRYIVGVDLRERPKEPLTPASAIGLVHLDIMAQERGFTPVAVTAWNVVGPGMPDAEGGGT